MSDVSETRSEKKSAWPFIIAAVVIVLLVAMIFASVLLKDSGSRGSEPPPFDPSVHAELEIKGVQPDGKSSWAALSVPAAPEPSDALITTGRGLFNKACAGCHGQGGAGNGPISARVELFTVPADLTQPLRSIKIRSTMAGNTPTREDLFRTITRGLPGTAMLSFRELSVEDRWALVTYVRSLSSEYEKRSGPPIEIPVKLAASDELFELGKAVFQRSCRTCHGEDGLGAAAGLQDNATGKIWPGLSFARQKGTRMLGGSSEDDIARTLLTGLNQRNPMMSWKSILYPESNPTPEARAAMDRRFWGTVWYVKRLAESTPEK